MKWFYKKKKKKKKKKRNHCTADGNSFIPNINFEKKKKKEGSS